MVWRVEAEVNMVPAWHGSGPVRSSARLRRIYGVASLGLIVVYPWLSDTGRVVAFRLVALGAIPPVILGLRRIKPGDRLSWWLLLSALIVVNIAGIALLVPSGPAMAAGWLLDAAGNVLVLAAALALVARRGRSNLGAIIDTTIVALAVGGLLWDAVLLPRQVDVHKGVAAQVGFFAIVFALSGVLGALVRLEQTSAEPLPALWLLMGALVLALAGNIVQALADGSWLRTLALMMFMGAYTGIGLYGLDPTAAQLARAEPIGREDALSVGRLVFLGAAVAVTPVVIGMRALIGGDVKGLLLAVGGAIVAVLVMVRIGRLAADRDRAEQALIHQAAHDPLTGLPNRREFVERLGDELSRGANTVVLFCDLDGFKAVNDRLGHAAGDQLLVEVARRLRACVRESDLVSRFGGDEFLILLTNARPTDIAAISERITNALSRPIQLAGERVTIGASIGMAVATGERDPEELIKRADHAMYHVKGADSDAPTVRMSTA